MPFIYILYSSKYPLERRGEYIEFFLEILFFLDFIPWVGVTNVAKR